VPTLANFCSNRVEPWAKIRPSWLWYRSGMRPLLQHKSTAVMNLDSITSETVAGYAAHRQSRGLQIGTINRELHVLRRMLRLAVEWGLIERAPKVQMLRGEKRRERVVGDEELSQYITSASPMWAEVATILRFAASFFRYANRSTCGRVDTVQDHGLVISVCSDDLHPPIRGSSSGRLFRYG
jgi:hypothetical protein